MSKCTCIGYVGAWGRGGRTQVPHVHQQFSAAYRVSCSQQSQLHGSESPSELKFGDQMINMILIY